MNDVKSSLKRENPGMGLGRNGTFTEGQSESLVESTEDEEAPTCMEKTLAGIFKCWNAFTRGFGKCMGLDDDAYAVSDKTEGEVTENDLFKQGILDTHNAHEEMKE